MLLDVDGVLAPIVPRPELSEVPEATLDLLRGLIERYRLVACVSGRTLDEVRRLVPLPGLLAAGNHGLELDLGDGPEPRVRGRELARAHRRRGRAARARRPTSSGASSSGRARR